MLQTKFLNSLAMNVSPGAMARPAISDHFGITRVKRHFLENIPSPQTTNRADPGLRMSDRAGSIIGFSRLRCLRDAVDGAGFLLK